MFHISFGLAWSFVWGSKHTKTHPWRRDWCSHKHSCVDYINSV